MPLILSGSAGLSGNVGNVTKDMLPVGSVLQVVTASKTNVFSMSGTSWTDVTGLIAPITPLSTTSKILVLINMNWATSDYRNGSGYRIMRDSTPICIGDAAGNRARVTGGWEDNVNNPTYTMFNASMNHLDSPGTASPVTYKIQLVQTDAFGITYVNSTGYDGDTAAFPRAASTLTLMEIKA